MTKEFKTILTHSCYKNYAAIFSQHPEAHKKQVAVEFRPAQGRKCARSWKILPSVGSDPDYPEVSPRDAKALREWDALRRAAE